MTREEAKEAKVEYLDCNDNLVISNIPTEDCHDLIDKIYDDFESRTCNKCEYIDYRGTWPYCASKDSSVYDILEKDVDTFGCNKWKAKND